MSSTQVHDGESEPSLIVGIGASAGGLGAFKTFFSRMSREHRLAFVLVQHLSPEHVSLLAELLGKVTSMTVLEATDRMAVAANHVYVIPPNATLTIADGVLHVNAPPPRQIRSPINTFFDALARDQGERAVGIILSGHGDDGASGLAAIKAHGGLTMVQADLSGDAMAGMPANASAGEAADLILPIEQMPMHLLGYQQRLSGLQQTRDEIDPLAELGTHLETITALLLAETGHDFSHYKKATLIRRIQHRMLVVEVASVRDYIVFLREQAGEPKRLFRELLISVTEFFRDPDVFEALREQALLKLLAERGVGDVVRIWVAGCATGEEAYSIAITLREAMQGMPGPKVQIFATDIDDRAIGVARIGRYGAPLTGISESRRERWFSRVGDEFYVNKEVREMCVFSTHSVIKDPPFSRIDLVSCRNVLIYLDEEQQDQLIHVFHYALRSDGFLLLGPSESLTRSGKLFAEIDKKHHLYRRREQPRVELRLPPLPDRSLPAGAVRPATATRSPDEALDQKIRQVLERHQPAYMVINAQHDVVRFGGDIGTYLAPSGGNASLNGFGLLRKHLRGAVRAAVSRVFAEGQGAMQLGLNLDTDGQRRQLRLVVEPLASEGGAVEYCVIGFDELARQSLLAADEADSAAASAELVRIRALEQELEATQIQLYTTAELHENALAELKAANEEYQSINEELQSTNEELETSREEMQAINEEVQAVNAQINDKNAALQRLNSELAVLLDSTQIATLFLDGRSCIENYTPTMTALFHLRDSDRGRPIHEIATRIHYPDLSHDFDAVTTRHQVAERVLVTRSGEATFLMRMRPFRRPGRSSDGVVLTFVDIGMLHAMTPPGSVSRASEPPPAQAIPPAR